MRAWLLDDTTGIEALRLGEVPAPEPGPGEVRVRMRVAGLNHLDVWVTHGLPKPKALPHILGGDGAGVVEQVGEFVTEWVEGDEVIINPSISCGRCEFCRSDEMVFCAQYTILGERLPGTLREMLVVPEANLFRRPPEVPWDVAGSFGLASSTAYRMLDRAGLQSGEALLVVGVGGGVSSAAALLGVAIGARVFVTSRDEGKIKWALAHGAEAGFDSTTEFAKEIKEWTGRGAHVVVENVGQATWEQSFRSLAPGGRMVVCGGTTGNKVELSLPVLWYKQLEIIGSSMANRSQFAATLDLVAAGKLPIPIDRVYGFENAPEAFRRLESGNQLGKVVISFS